MYLTDCPIKWLYNDQKKPYDWSLVTGRGGTKRMGAVKFYPYEKGGGGAVAMLKGGHKMFGVGFAR